MISYPTPLSSFRLSIWKDPKASSHIYDWNAHTIYFSSWVSVCLLACRLTELSLLCWHFIICLPSKCLIIFVEYWIILDGISRTFKVRYKCGDENCNHICRILTNGNWRVVRIEPKVKDALTQVTDACPGLRRELAQGKKKSRKNTAVLIRKDKCLWFYPSLLYKLSDQEAPVTQC